MDLTKNIKKKQKFIPEYLTEMNAIMAKMNASLTAISKNLEILREYEEKRREVIGRITESANKTEEKQEENADDQQTEAPKKRGGKKGGVHRAETAQEESVQ